MGSRGLSSSERLIRDRRHGVFEINRGATASTLNLCVQFVFRLWKFFPHSFSRVQACVFSIPEAIDSYYSCMRQRQVCLKCSVSHKYGCFPLAKVPFDSVFLYFCLLL